MDPTVVAIPTYFGTMGLEYLWLKRRAERTGAPAPTDYERHDTLASLAMGVGSLLAPLVVPKVLGPVLPKGRLRTALIGTAIGAVAVTAVADRVGRTVDAPGGGSGAVDADPEGSDHPGSVDDANGDAPATPGVVGGAIEGSDRSATEVRGGGGRWRAWWNRTETRRSLARAARTVAGPAAATAVVTGGAALTTAWASRVAMDKMWARRIVPDLGGGALAMAAAMVGWDFIYYWNHRLMHESRFMWAIHVVHHSSERYNLSTALRQPVADVFGLFAPYGVMALFGIRPHLIAQARGWNLLYQYWIHTDAIGRLGPFERVFNTPSHHRAHHGSNPQYLDRNHGGILIIWDKLFGTFEPEEEPVVYGLTTNIETFNPARIATHEHADIVRDVARADTWSDRLSYVVRGPGWAYARRAAATSDAPAPTTPVAALV